MTLYTICIDDLPVVVMSAGAELPIEDSMTTNAEMMKMLRESNQLKDQMHSEVKEMADRLEIQEAIDSWLGDDLQVLEHDGRPLWDGTEDSLKVRPANEIEAGRWHTSFQDALNKDEELAGTEDLLIWLVQVTDPTDEGDDEE